ncbi:unnamed protein product [Cylicocyclus nassatus]|uniref:Metalloendopeptidase n=1 Tax=Cylicocyclus nassatus TaxID=53992 RepID=A0AA36GPX7_CYLNA|nr:unnamed protein product [Cylicocyclus nassatus]
MLIKPLLLFFLSSVSTISPAPTSIALFILGRHSLQLWSKLISALLSLIRPIRISKQPYGDIIQIEELMKRRMYKSAALPKIKRIKWDQKDADGNIVIPYTIVATDYVQQARENISKAMKRIEDHTCIRFTERKNEKYYVEINNIMGRGCRTYVGKNLKKGKTIMLLEFNQNDTCMYISSIQHELLHAVGLWHEQNNYNRDNYIKINYANLLPGYSAQFRKHPNIDANIYNLTYDYMSIMHYERDAFSRNGKDTIVTLDPKYQDIIGTVQDASPTDYLKVCQIYACKKCKIPK